MTSSSGPGNGPPPGRGAVRVRGLVAAAAVVALIGYLVMDLLRGQLGSLPAPSIMAAGLLALVAVAELVMARHISRGVKGATRKPLDPLWAYRTLLVGQASAVTGAVVAGWYVAFVITVLPDVDAASVRGSALAAAAMVGAAVFFSVAGLSIQSAARIDPPSTSPTGGDSSDQD